MRPLGEQVVRRGAGQSGPPQGAAVQASRKHPALAVCTLGNGYVMALVVWKRHSGCCVCLPVHACTRVLPCLGSRLTPNSPEDGPVSFSQVQRHPEAAGALAVLGEGRRLRGSRLLAGSCWETLVGLGVVDVGECSAAPGLVHRAWGTSPILGSQLCGPPSRLTQPYLMVSLWS